MYMSLSTDVLSRATPTRLICRSGRWVLEVTRLEAVDRDVFQPRLQRLEGQESILAMLRRSEEGQLLASAAAQLMRTSRAEDDRAFEVNDGDWVPSAELPAAPRHAPASATETSEMAVTLAELRAELVVLRASHSRLRDRVAALEASQSGLAPLNTRLPRGTRARRRSEPPPALVSAEPVAGPFGENAGFAATQASPGLGAPVAAAPRRGPAAAAAPPAVRQPSFDELAQALSGEPLPPPLKLPSLQALNDCLRTLMEQAPALEQASAELALESLHQPLACKLLDDDGRERGVIVLDLTATVMLGTALLAVPRKEALEQAQSKEPSEDNVLATSEICNNWTGPVNAVSGNQHVRSTALVSVDVGALARPRARLDLTVDGGNVIVAMF
jgi:hypothetical protein